MFTVRDLQLNQFDRAVQVAQAYQHYRIKKVTFTLKPDYDTYATQLTVGGGYLSKPSLYFYIDKSGSMISSPTLEMLKQAGCKAFRLDEKPFKISYRPSVLEATLNQSAGITANKYRVSPWLSTSAIPTASTWSPSTVQHLGLFLYVETSGGSVGTVTFSVDCEVQFQFKKPIWNALASSQASVPVLLKTEVDTSPDGVVDNLN